MMSNSQTRIAVAATAVVIVVLAATAILSGYGYQLDTDEIAHANAAYLNHTGHMPYRDYFSIYTPLFHWLIDPVLASVGYTFAGIHAIRVLMIGLFAAGCVFWFSALRRVFSKRVAVVAMLFLLSDPFTVFAGMQIRPDTLMMTLLAAGVWAVSGNTARHKAAGYMLLGLSALVSLKILPVVLTLSFFAALPYMRRNAAKVAVFAAAFFAPFVCFAAYFLYLGISPMAVRQSIWDAPLTNASMLYPLPLGNFHIPGNPELFGFGGYPVTWVFACLLPLLGFAGALTYGVGSWRRGQGRPLANGIATAFVVECTVLAFTGSVFIQYYLPLSLLSAILASYLLNTARVPKIVLAGLCLVLAVSSAWANVNRASIHGYAQERIWESRWKSVPPGESVLMGMPFRPPVHPLPFGYFIGDMPPEIRERWPSIRDMLGKNNVRYVLVSDFSLKFVPTADASYIRSGYTPLPDDPELRVRND